VESTIRYSSYEWEYISTGQLGKWAGAAQRAEAINSVAAPVFAVLVGTKLGFYAACR
jgi:hypothetical protein